MKGLKINKYKLATVTSMILLVFTPWINSLVNAIYRSGTSQQHGFGSECLLWLLPIMVLGILDVFSTKKI